MYCLRQILPDLWWVGGNDRRIALFENVFPVPRGISYNSYLLLDEKTVLLDTVDKAGGEVFFDNLEHLLGQRPLDYVVVNHMEPDHCATLADLLRRHPETTVVGNTKTFQLIQQFFGLDLKISATRKPKKVAAVMPPAAAVIPPVRAPRKPCSATAFLTPLTSR